MSKRNKKQNIWKSIIWLAIIAYVIIFEYIPQNVNDSNQANNLSNVQITNVENKVNNEIESQENVTFDLATIPEYTTDPYVEINNNIPYFTEKDYTTEPFEKYSEWQNGRSGVAYANICREIMPAEGEERGEIGSVKDLSGWVQKRYDNLIKDKYLYNRCHLIGWQLAGENDNKKNLITGTRYLNTEGMLPFENIVAEYIETNKNNHVLYRVTPVFEGENRLASGVQMEAWSVEDNGQGICFNVYCYNVQPGIVIDYETGESHEK